MARPCVDIYKYTKALLSIALIAFPVAIPFLPHINGLVVIALALTGFYLVIRRDPVLLNPCVQEKQLYMSVAIFLLSVLLVAMFANGESFSKTSIGKFLYFLLIVPVYFGVKKIGVSRAAFWYGLAAGAMVSLMVALYDVAGHDSMLRARGINHPIIFGDLALLMGVMPMAGLSWFRQQSRWHVLIPFAALLAGLLASFLSQSRGGWVALPVLAIIFVWHYRAHVARWKIISGLVLLLIFVVTVYQVPQTGVRETIYTTIDHVGRYLESDVTSPDRATSIGSRFEMWRASWILFVEHPVFGVGWGRYQEQTQLLVNRGLINQMAADFPHPHNQFMSSLASGGITGFAGMLLLFIVLILIFWRGLVNSQGHDSDKLSFALAGVILVVSFFVFNLSESFMERSRTVAFVVFYAAILMAGSFKNRMHDEDS
jgi:O-antigen ligase